MTSTRRRVEDAVAPPFDFAKYQAAENDFLVVDADRQPLADPGATARALCHRRRGVGADGLLVLTASSGGGHRVRVINADGGEAETSGNGLRCAARYLLDRGVDADGMVLHSGAGRAEVRLDGDELEISMGPPRLHGAGLPPGDGATPAEVPVFGGGLAIRGTAISMGNPHVVLEMAPCADLAGVALDELAAGAAASGAFPEGVNVEVIAVDAPGRVRARVWERGVGETRACGSGACAVAAALTLTRGASGPQTIEMPGGTLRVRWSGALDQPMWLAGPAEEICTGRIARR